MELSAQNLSPYLNAEPRFAHAIADAYNAATGRSRLSRLERLALRIIGEPILVTWDHVDRALDGAPGIVRTERYYDIEWDPRSNTASPMRAGWYPMYAKHP